MRWRVRYSHPAADGRWSDLVSVCPRPLTYFPFAVDLQGQKVLVVGGGKVAERKVFALLKARADVWIVAPQLTGSLQELNASSRVQWQQKDIARTDLQGFRLVIAATNHTGINEDVSRWAKAAGVWINVVDNPGLSDFISPAVFFAEEGIVAVYSDGKDPVLSRDLKNFIERQWHEFLSYRDQLPHNVPSNTSAGL